jgi:hypothetical protein
MGLLLTCNEVAPIPRQVVLTLACDGDHGLLGPTKQQFLDGHFIEQYRAAMQAGWKETERRGARIFLCPECSGK